MELLCWNDDKFRDGVYEENKDTPNHCCDAALYAWRYIFNYLYEPEIDPFDMTNPSEKRMLYRMQEENKKQEYEEVEVVAEWNS